MHFNPITIHISSGAFSSDLVTDFTIIADNIKFHLRKFPLISKEAT
ncbi:hypothetical protein Hanom_Chr03g00229911 [Helianthus anomalus]